MAMLKTLKMGGVSYPFLFGFYAMVIAEEEFGLTIDKYMDGTATDTDWVRNLPKFVFAGLKNGAYANDNEVTLTVHKIQAELDKQPSLVKETTKMIFAALTDWMAAQAETTETAKSGRQGVQKPPKPQA